VAQIMSAAMPTKSFLLPQSGGGLMQKTITGPDGQPQVITGQVFTDPITKETYFQAGKNRYDTSGLSTPAQNIQNVFGAAQAGGAGKVAGETGMTAPPLQSFPGQAGGTTPAPAANNVAAVAPAPVDPAAVSRAQRDLQALQNEITKIPATDPKREERLRILNSEIANNQNVLTKAGQSPVPITQPFWKQKQAADLATEQSKANIQAAKEISVAEAKVPAEERGKQAAKDIAKQGFADSTYPLLSAVREEISKSTGSSIGAGVDELGRIIGASTKGAEAIAKLNVLAGPIKMNIPRFEGAQSDRDVQEYARQAGDFANPKLTVKERLAALDAMETLLKKYDKAGTNDWTYGRTAPTDGTTSSGNKYKRVK